MKGQRLVFRYQCYTGFRWERHVLLLAGVVLGAVQRWPVDDRGGLLPSAAHKDSDIILIMYLWCKEVNGSSTKGT